MTGRGVFLPKLRKSVQKPPLHDRRLRTLWQLLKSSYAALGTYTQQSTTDLPYGDAWP